MKTLVPDSPKRGKDTPKFEPGTPQGPVNYPPYETCAEFYEEHCIYPQGKLMDYAHTYLYRSDKREFNDKTGRDDFRVFAYQFLWRGVARYVLWDYISGRIRVTHLFKCNNLAKTAPKKFLDANPGLKDLSYNITGGTLATQGYWMPFECVKALAKNWFFELRYVLVPIFGPDFPSECIRPGQPGYESWKIDREIVRQEAIRGKEYRKLQLPRPASCSSPSVQDREDNSWSDLPSLRNSNCSTPVSFQTFTALNTPQLQQATPPTSPPTQTTLTHQASESANPSSERFQTMPTAEVTNTRTTKGDKEDTDMVMIDADGDEREGPSPWTTHHCPETEIATALIPSNKRGDPFSWGPRHHSETDIADVLAHGDERAIYLYLILRHYTDEELDTALSLLLLNRQGTRREGPAVATHLDQRAPH